MLMCKDGMRNFLSAAHHLTMHSSETVRSILKNKAVNCCYITESEYEDLFG